MEQIYLFWNNIYKFNYSIDASSTDCLAKYVNDSPKKYPNSATKVVADEYPRLVLVALKNIQMFEEIHYDYQAPIREENVSIRLN